MYLDGGLGVLVYALYTLNSAERQLMHHNLPEF